MDSKDKNVSSEKVRPESEHKRSSEADIELRPSAGHGWWLSYLLVGAYLSNCWKFERSLTFEYKFSTVVAFGLVLQTEAYHYNRYINKWTLRWMVNVIPTITTTLLLIYILDQDVIFSLFSGFTTVLTYQSLFKFVLRKMPKCFTYGEASIVVQAFVIFLTNLYFKLILILEKTSDCMNDSEPFSCVMYSNTLWTPSHEHTSEMAHLTTILQIGLLGVSFMVGCCYFIKLFRGLAFYVLLSSVATVVILFPIDDEPALIILLKFITKDLQKLCMIVLYTGLIGMTVATVSWQMNRNDASNTRTRKIFHVLIVLVFVPGLIYQCAFLYVACGIALALLIVLETMRVMKLRPIYNILEHSVKCFIDEKDAGCVALTPIYLLAGCSTPLWLHPCPCDLTDSTVFSLLPLMSGVISVGIGDTAASIVGSKFGTLKWPNSQKTVAGTVAGIIAQGLVFPILVHCGLIRYTSQLLIQFLVAVTFSSLVETFTDQVDNLVLPLVTFILLSL